MRKDGKYRFSLQFPETTEENRRVGELLERMGNRKSALIVDAVGEYLRHHPELQEENCKIEISMTPAGVSAGLEHLIRQMVEERVALYHKEAGSGNQSGEVMPAGKEVQEEPPDNLEEDISQMLDNLDFFQ